MEARMMPVAEIHAAPDNLRHNLGKLKELAASIEAVGILQPLVVRPNDEGYEIIAGHRRFAAATSLGLTEVPVVIRADLVDAAKVEAMIVENFHRDDLSAIEQAEGLFRLEEIGLNRATVAEKTGLSKKLVGERIKLLDLPKTAQTAIHQGQLSIDAGLTLAKAATAPEVIDVAIKSVLEDGREPGWAIKDAQREVENAHLFADLQEKAEQLREKGIEVVNKNDLPARDYYGPSIPRGWSKISTDDRHGWSEDLKVDRKAHAREECVVFILDEGRGFTEPSLLQYCKQPKRHTFTGKSEVKIPDAEKVADEAAGRREFTRKQREATAARKARYQEALAGKKPPRALTSTLAIAGLIEKIWTDTVKDASILLGLEPVESQGFKSYHGPFREFAAKDPDRAILALVLADRDPLARVDAGWLGKEGYEAVLSLIPDERKEETE